MSLSPTPLPPFAAHLLSLGADPVGFDIDASAAHRLDASRPLCPALIHPDRVSRFISRAGPEEQNSAILCNKGLMGGGGGATLHGGMGMVLSAASAESTASRSLGQAVSLRSITVDYKGPVPLPAWLIGEGRTISSGEHEVVGEGLLRLPDKDVALVRSTATWVPARDIPSSSFVHGYAPELPTGLERLIQSAGPANHDYSSSELVVISNLTPPTASHRFDHPARIHFIWKTLYAPGQLERSFETLSQDGHGESWYEFRNADGCLSRNTAAVDTGILFSIVDFSMSNFARVVGQGLTVTATLTFEPAPAAAQFVSGWIQVVHKCAKADGRKLFLESTARDGQGNLIATGKGLWIRIGPLPKL
ncbi:hypothetical protein DFJ74DRAFT_650337 [Hyaloraphidium curvatum]|nr:hypothetical protein DFJ74DRAFT_650337 [Hyaloraphidium curvatum]